MGEIDENPEQPMPTDQSEAIEVPDMTEVSEASDVTDTVEVNEAPDATDTVEVNEAPDATDTVEVTEVTVAAGEAESTSPPGDTELTESVESDDLAAALVDAEDKVAQPDSLDDIAPETTHATPEAAPVVAVRAAGVPWWPFLAYLGAWVVLTGVAVWQLVQLPPAQVAYESQAYGLMVLGGLIMTAVGPLLILSVWFAVWAGRAPGERSGLLTSALLKGAVVTLGGAVFWWVALIVVDSVRLGSPL